MLQEKKVQELGSEFWLNDLPPMGEKDNACYVLSGRTAIDVILQDILSQRSVKNVYMPAWCCDSMLRPFIDNGIEIQVYDICYSDGRLVYDIAENINADIFYITNYFGYDNNLSEDVVRLFKNKGSVIMYDRTHSLFIEDKQYTELADYSFASIRKWLGVPCGAYVVKRDGSLSLPMLHDYPYLFEKIEAMKLKYSYMSGDSSVDKQSFLDKFGSFSHHLSECYRDYKIDDLSLLIWQCADKNNLTLRRKSNSACLQSGLMGLQQVQVMFVLGANDCPLFVPVLFDTQTTRDRVRKYLTQHSVYCPIHWPKPNIISDSMQVCALYNRGLSLVCDQRYTNDDMWSIISLLEKAI